MRGAGFADIGSRHSGHPAKQDRKLAVCQRASFQPRPIWMLVGPVIVECLPLQPQHFVPVLGRWPEPQPVTADLLGNLVQSLGKYLALGIGISGRFDAYLSDKLMLTCKSNAYFSEL